MSAANIAPSATSPASTATSTTSPSDSRQPSAASAPAGASTATSATGPVGIPAPQAHHAANPPGALGHGRATTNPGTSSSSGAPLSSASLPGPSSVQHVTEARAAVVASIGNLVDRELQGRATMLHGNAAAIARQEGEVARATEALRRENDKLSKVVNDAARKVKEAGNVQNWAEVLERDFLVLEETLRLVRKGSGDEESWSGTGSEGTWSGSGSREGSVIQAPDATDGGNSRSSCLVHRDDNGDVQMNEDLVPARVDKGKGKEIHLPVGFMDRTSSEL